MQLALSIQDELATITLAGKFGYPLHSLFREIYEVAIATEGVKYLDIDFGQVTSIDSSSLGILLLVNEWATASNVTLRLVNPQGKVKQDFVVANFDKLFSISY